MHESHRPAEAQILTPGKQRTKELFYQSYRFSQGSTSAQQDIFRWLGRKGYLDDLTLPKKAPDYILETKPMQNHVPQTSKQRVKDIYQVWADLQAAQRDKNYVSKKIIKEIYQKNLESDIAYQDQRIRRPNRPISETVEPDSLKDPHASQLRRYAIHGESTKTNAFDEMYKEIRLLIEDDLSTLPKEPRKRSESQKALLRLLAGWEQNHPGEKFFT
jgi:hypothetical protein